MKLLFSLSICLLAVSAFAADRFVRPGGSGNGTSWDNAWGSGSSVVTANDMRIFVAGGNEIPGNWVINANNVTIERARATNSACTGVTGWDNSYDQQVHMNKPDLTAGATNFYINGVVPYIGIHITNGSFADSYSINVGVAAYSNITIYGCDVQGNGFDAYDTSGESRCWNSSPGGSRFRTGLTIRHCTLRNAPTIASMFYDSNVLIESNIFHSNLTGDTGHHHPNNLQVVGCTNVIFRYNIVTNVQAEALAMMDFSSPSDAPNDTWYIYGNLLHTTLGAARALEAQYRAQYRIFFYFNTVIGFSSSAIRTANGGSWHSSCQSFCNITINSGGPAEFSGGTNNYNLTDASNSEPNGIGGASTSIFVDYAARNFHIKTNIGALFPAGKGIDLGADYRTDLDGQTRATPPSIGAYEANPGSFSDTTSPAVTITSPTNGTTYSTSTAAVSLAGTASDNVSLSSVSYSNDRGGSGACTGTTSWSKDAIQLFSGANIITITATDTSGNTATDTLTVTYTPISAARAPFRLTVGP